MRAWLYLWIVLSICICLSTSASWDGCGVKFDSKHRGGGYEATGYDEEEWIMEEEYHGASESVKKKRRKRTKKSAKQSAEEEEDEDDWCVANDESEVKEEDKSGEMEGEEHPMRTDEWEIHVRVTNILPRAKKQTEQLLPETPHAAARGDDTLPTKNKRRQIMKFAPNGYVLLVEENYDNKSPDFGAKNDTAASAVRRVTRVGKWKVDHTGVSWDIPATLDLSPKEQQQMSIPSTYHTAHTPITVDINHDDNDDDEEDDNAPATTTTTATSVVPKIKKTVLHYHADLHLNKFGERPRMRRGIITRDRFRYLSFLPPHLFRPVIATFSAEGVGKDMIDITYKERQMLQEQMMQQQ
uniref:Uncharacterized protein n=1 Tax=Ditylum brightwellii TaxID=49249 RepID=A0A7S4QWF8_9STRA